jgi:hypothetical protein
VCSRKQRVVARAQIKSAIACGNADFLLTQTDLGIVLRFVSPSPSETTKFLRL